MTDNTNQENQETAEARSNLRQITRNAYRILGLPADASCRTISDRGAALHRAAKAGIPRHSAWNFEWHGALRRDEVDISGALGRLRDPRQRLRERLFWIAQSEIFVKRIPTQGLDASIEPLRASYSSQNHHDAAVLALISCASSDPKINNPQRWTGMLQLWIDTLAREEFWSEFLEAENAGDFEPAASPEELAALRTDCFRLVAEPVAQFARGAASHGEFDRCGRLLEVVQRSGLPGVVISALEEDVLGPYEDTLSQLFQEVTKTCWNAVRQDRQSVEANKKVCFAALNRWRQEVEPKYEEFLDMIGRLTSAHEERATHAYTDFLSSLANACTWADEWIEAEVLFTEAQDHMLSTNPAWNRIEASLRNITHAAAQQRLERQSQVAENPQLSLSFTEKTIEEHEPEPGVRTKETTNAEASFVVEARNLAGFCDLCTRVKAKCSESFAVSQHSPQTQRLGVLIARDEYRNTIAPWLKVILATYKSDSNVVNPVKSAAAGCLNSIAGAFLLVSDLDNAHNLAAEAFALVAEDERLAREVKHCLQRIAAERERLQRKRTDTPPRTAALRNQHIGKANESDDSATELSAFQFLFRLAAAAVAVIGFVVLAGIFGSPGDKIQHLASPDNHSVPSSTKGEKLEQPVSAIPEGFDVVKTGPNSYKITTPMTRKQAADLVASAKRMGLQVSDNPPIGVPAKKVVELVPSTPRLLTLRTPEHREPFSLPNGTNLIESFEMSGRGRLVISNYEIDDAVVKLKSTTDGKTLRFVYVRGMSDLAISGIAQGEYLLQFSSGRDWDATISAFRENQTFSQFGRHLHFAEEPEGNYIHYSEQTVTLHTVPNGNVEKRTITAADFNS